MTSSPRSLFLGVVPSKTGAFALLDSAGNIVQVADMPVVHGQVDPDDLFRALARHADSIRLAYVENNFIRDGEAAPLIFARGKYLGVVLGILVALQIPHQAQRPAAPHGGNGQAPGMHNYSKRKALALALRAKGDHFAAIAALPRPEGQTMEDSQ